MNDDPSDLLAIPHSLKRECGRPMPPTGGRADFQQAKTADRTSQFLQIVAKPDALPRKKRKEPKLTRVAFRVSRLMEFCTRRELQNQTGHTPGNGRSWCSRS